MIRLQQRRGNRAACAEGGPMRDPFSWSFPLGRVSGILVRMHVLFPLVGLGLWLRVVFHRDPPYPPGAGLDMLVLEALLLVSVLLHELGHCFGARRVDGDAQEVLLWPLGGLASLDVPHRPLAHFITAAAGPAVNVLICLATAAALAALNGARPPFELSWAPFRSSETTLAELHTWGGVAVAEVSPTAALLARAFWLNWVLILLNLLPGFPLDGGRLLQGVLWPWYGYRQATAVAVFAGFVTAMAVGICAIVYDSVLTLCLGIFIYVTCKQQYILLETGGDDGLFGYDFSQGYTSLEGDAPPRRKRAGTWQRWLQRRAQVRRQRERERREAEERRMDQLLEKVQRQGLPSLTEEERRFLRRVSDRYRHK
jgi:Zn-dependent protease